MSIELSPYTRKRYWIFYLLVAYILAVFFWWWILLFKKNDELYREKVQLIYHRYQQEDSGLLLKEHDQLMQEYRRQRWMVVGEGGTFIFLLLFGIYRLRRTIIKEVELAQRQRNFLLSITHELKSPLASAQLNLQTIRKRNLEKDKQELLLNNTAEDISRLNELVEKILLASKMDLGKMQINREEVCFSELLEDCIERVLHRQPSQRILSDVSQSIWVKGDDVMLQSLVLNLLENAVKYAPTQSTIKLSLHQQGTQLLLDVADEGEKIPDAEKSRIFERFYRMGNEDTRTSTGVGLGLFIVQQVAAMHNGKVEIVDLPVGKAFRVLLPTLIDNALPDNEG
jgi:two-component system, OmpR family, sensor histidine kinase CiaH